MRQTVLTIVLVLTLAATGFVWYRYLGTPSPESLPSASAEPGVISERLRQLKAVRLDTGLFADPRFKALERPAGLRPVSTTTPGLTPGRANPFAPL